MNKLRIVTLIAASGLGASPLAAQAPTAAEIQRIDSVFAKFDGTARPGCALGVSRNGEPIYLRAYGMADLQNGLAITPQSIFHVASVSKQFAAIAVALLAEDGKLSLDDDVRKFIPELPDLGPGVTLRRLMYHTSGVRDHWELLGMAGWRYPDDLFTQQDVLDILVRQNALNFKPGDEYLYSNGGYTLLAIVASRVSGKSLREFSEERIFRPLGMTSTHVHDDHTMIVPGRTSAYEMRKDGWHISIPVFDTHGATSLFTTVGDLLKWEQNFVTGKVGSRSLLKEAETTAVLNNGKPANYGFGISVETYRGTPAFGHGGADAGYRADVVRFPAHQLAIAVTCNFAEATPGSYARGVADILLEGKLAAKPAARNRGPVSVSKNRLEQLAGVYKVRANDQVIRLGVKDSSLMIENYGVPLQPVDDNHFTAFGTPVAFDGGPTAVPTVLWAEALGDSMFRMPAFRPTTAQLGEFAADYWSDEVQSWYRITLKDSVLVLKRPKFDAANMDPVFADAFLVAGGAGTIRFVRAKGKVTGFLLTGGRVRNVSFTRGPNRP
jgi:CubicO group peptidase (beta-lactamase class C family)